MACSKQFTNSGNNRNERCGTVVNNYISIKLDTPARFLGAVFGPKGSRIRKIEKKYNSIISIDRQNESAQLFGRANDVEKEKNEIMESIAKERCRVESGSYEFLVTSTKNLDISRNTADIKIQQDWSCYGEIKKDFYIIHNQVSNRTANEVKAIRAGENKIDVEYPHGCAEGTSIPALVQTFEEAFLYYPEVLQNLKWSGFN